MVAQQRLKLYNDPNANKQHQLLGIALTTYRYLSKIPFRHLHASQITSPVTAA